jgi:glycosyltransferase involved in cell wall biosynthesis
VKVMLLADDLGNGGAERQLSLLAKGLPGAWERRVCALGDGPFTAYLRERGIPVQILTRRSRLDPVPAVGLWRSILACAPDVVHSWGWMSTMVAGPLCRLRGVPLVDGIRTGALFDDHLRLRRLGMTCATTIVANSRAGLRAWGVSPAKGAVVYNGFDWSRVGPHEASAGAVGGWHSGGTLDDGRFTVVMTGRMVPVKDYRTVIDAARLLGREDRAWRFVLVGDGEERARLMAEAADLVDEGTARFPEPGLEVLGHVRAAHVGVLMTDPAQAQEGLSNSIMEYMACGLPVVCSDGGGNREVVLDGTTGFVVPPSDARQLAAKLAFLRDHEPERRAMGQAGRQRVTDAFSIEQMVAGFVRVYEQALSAARRT